MPLVENDKVSPVWFTPSSQEDEETPVEFRIKPLTSPRLLEVLQKQDLNMAIMYGLVDWRNYVNKAGHDIKFRLSKLDGIPADILSEIANEIINNSRLTEDEQKN